MRLGKEHVSCHQDPPANVVDHLAPPEPDDTTFSRRAWCYRDHQELLLAVSYKRESKTGLLMED